MRDPYRGFGSWTILAGYMSLSELLPRCFVHVREGRKSVTPIRDAAPGPISGPPGASLGPPWCLSEAFLEAAGASREGQNA